MTALRWALLLRRLGWHTFVERSWSGRPCDVLVAIHAVKSAESIRRYAEAHPGGALVVLGAGTDLYGDEGTPPDTLASFELADRVVVLQPLALDTLPSRLRERARVIFQSAKGPPARPSPAPDAFEVCVLANLRPVKDPLRAAFAARELPASSRVRVLLLGNSHDDELRAQAERESDENGRFEWLGERPRADALELLWRSRLLACTSRHEGGANVVTEALAAGVPVIASRIPGSLGLLGEDYAGTYPVGDTDALRALLERAEGEPGFLARLEEQCAARTWITAPELEQKRWRELLEELRPDGASRT